MENLSQNETSNADKLKIQDNEQSLPVYLFDGIHKWFLPLISVIYASGFLILLVFFDRFGIREATTEFFKAKYVLVGIMGSAPMFMIAIPINAFLLFKWKVFGISTTPPVQKDGLSEEHPVYWSTVLICIKLCIIFYLLSLYAPIGFFDDHRLITPLSIALSSIGPIIIHTLFKYSSHTNRCKVITIWSLRLLCVGTFVIDYCLLQGLFPVLWEMMKGGGYIHFIFVVMANIAIYQTVRRVKENPNYKNRYLIWIIGICFATAFYSLSIISFAINCYSYIPVSKGGGDYCESDDIVIYFTTDKVVNNVPSEILEYNKSSILRSKPLKVILETPTSLFVADPTQAGGPCNWRDPAQNKQNIFELKNNLIASIIYIREDKSAKAWRRL